MNPTPGPLGRPVAPDPASTPATPTPIPTAASATATATASATETAPATTVPRPTVRTARPPRFRRAGWLTVTLLAAAIALLSARYLTADPDTFLEEQRAVYLAHLAPLLLHIGGGTAALLLGPWQFVVRLRTRHPVLHRITGYAYLLSVTATAVGGLVLVPEALVPPIAPLGFAFLDVLLVVTTVAAVHTARRRRFDRHRVWMVRSYALILAAVTLRLWLILFSALDVPFEESYASAAWTCWLINLLLAELTLKARPLPPALARDARSAASPPPPAALAPAPSRAATPSTDRPLPRE
ncbi:DUF2306 domain-containing protein [Streptomyces sp. NPDC097619]|uniref:DUF2306 domain-containing protein n=1 Tax=Streptomyces sp. NPDC097619 TaxID=3157228 RepID=UPI003324C08F